MPQRLELLKGIRIIAFTQWLSGPVAAQYLGDMGADVIKVEPQGGSWERDWAGGDTFLNGISACFLMTHRNVRSVAIDLKQIAGRDAARRLIGSADVVISNYRPGVMDRMGLGYESAKEAKPDIIYASVSGYGETGPSADLPGQDILIQALSGMIWVGGQQQQTPRPAGSAVVDQHAGLLLATGILGAVVHRERTGVGQEVHVTMLEAALDLQLEPLVYHMNGGRLERPKTPVGSAFHQAPYGVYETKTGHIVLSMTSMAIVSAALGSPASLDEFEEHERLTRKDDIYRAIAPLLRDEDRDSIVAELREKGVWCAPVLDYSEALAEPGLQHLNPVLELEHPVAGTVSLLKHPIRYSSGESTIVRPPPGVGQHSGEVLAELGYSDEEIAVITRRAIV